MELDHVIADLFDLDAQVRPATSAQAQPKNSSEDCTSDTCTATCSGCRP
jgi:hypothetical protein